MPLPNLIRIPRFLRVISKDKSGSQGDHPRAWGIPRNENYCEYGGSLYNYDYLDWLGRFKRDAYYFDENSRTKETEHLWAKYDWYLREAEKINDAIDRYNADINIYNELEKDNFVPNEMNLYKTRGLKSFELDSAFYSSKILTLTPPSDPQHTLGVQRWLQEAIDRINKYRSILFTGMRNFKTAASEYEYKRFKEAKQIYEEREGAKETKRFYELKGTIDETDRRLTANLNQLRTDVFNELKKQGDLFSDLSSVRDKKDSETIAQFNEALMESSNVNISLQSDVDKLNNKTDEQKKDLEILRSNFKNLKNLYDVSESKLRFNESKLMKVVGDEAETNKNVKDLTVQIGDQKKQSDEKIAKLNQTMQEGQERFEGTIGELRKELGTVHEKQDKTNKSLTGIQEKLEENSVLFANEREKILGEIESLKDTTGNIQPRLNALSSKLTALAKKHDAVKTELLGQLKEQQALNQTQFEKLNAENEARGKRYNKDVSQLRRDLDVTRALADRLEDEAIQAQNAFQEQGQRHEKQEKRNKARFKVLFDYQTNVDRQIKIQEKKTTNFAQLKKIRVMPDKAKALANFRRGRYAPLKEFV